MTVEDRVLMILKLMANGDFDADAYAKSESFQTMCENMACMVENPDEDGAEAKAYWRQRGLLKELHDTGSYETKWASYLPVSSAEAGRLYPLLFVLHGNTNSIYLAETYGYVNIAAREELITIIPENESAESIERLLEYARSHYPVDWSRVYMVGYSLGGIMTSRHALRWPEKFAAAGVGGMLFASGEIGTIWQQDVAWPGEAITEEMIAHAAKTRIPVCICMGENELLNLLPLTLDKPVENVAPQAEAQADRPAPQMDLSSKSKIASVNNWRRVAGCEPVEEDLVRQIAKSSADIVTEKLGFPFERTSVLNTEGRSHFIGDCVNPEDQNLARFVGFARSSHWPSQAMAEITWDFISQFARDLQTHELIFLKRG